MIIFVILIGMTLLYMLVMFRLGLGLNKLSGPDNSDRPSVSVIVSLHNEEKNIPSLLNHLSSQIYDKEKLEIILVDDRSGDQTPKLLQQFEIPGVKISIIRIDETPSDFAPKKYALHRAVSQATGEILVFTDADGRPGPEWISSLVRYFTPSTGMVLGYAPYTSPDGRSGMVFRLLSLEYFSHAAVAAATTGLGYPVTCVGTNLAFRKPVYEQLGGYGDYRSVHTGDDDLFLQRVREESDWQIRYAVDHGAHVWNAPPASWQQFYHQRLRYASKGLLYPLFFRISLILFYLYYVCLAAGFIFAFLYSFYWSYFIIAFVGKLIADIRFLSRAGRIMQDGRYIYLTIFAQILHIPYVLYFGLAAQLSNYQWGSRKGKI